MRIGFLRIRRYFEVTDETPAGVIGENEFEELVRCAASHSVVDMRLRRDGFVAVEIREGVYLRLAAGAEVVNDDIVLSL